MKNMIIQQCVLGAVYTNCYFLMHKETKELLIVDPADAPEKIRQMVDRMGGTPVGVLLTHGHFDHIMAAEAVRDIYDLKIYAHKAEAELLRDSSVNLSGYQKQTCCVVPDVLLEDEEIFEAAGFSIRVLHTPGHTAGSCCYYFEEEEILISGDTLFCESVGRTDLPTGSTRQIIESLHRLLDTIPDQVNVLPGHESATTIAHEKRYNPFV